MQEACHKRSHNVRFHFYQMSRIERQIPRDKIAEWLPGPGSRESGGVSARGDGVPLWGAENVLELDNGEGCTAWEYIKTAESHCWKR